MPERIPSVRISPSNDDVLKNLGLLKELAGTWHGHGFNLVARPAFEFGPTVNLFLELNLTDETLKFDPISSSIPNRGVFQDDIDLYGLTYLQKISDATTGGALHIEPGIWVTQPPTTQPPLQPPAGSQLVARMGNIPHGNSILVEGIATPFSTTPVISPGANPITGASPTFSLFPSFNSTPTTPPFPQPIFAAGNSEAQSKPGGGFSQYTLTNAASPTNPRTPLGNVPPVLPPAITQQLVNDPIVLLQQKIQQQIAEGHQFEGVVLNISSVPSIIFNTQPIVLPGTPTSPTVTVSAQQFGGGAENLGFLQTNADVPVVYATFWIERVTHPSRPAFMQLQYAQFVHLNFPANGIPSSAPPPASDNGKLNFSWPHITVSTLHKTFG